jgi:hypothetical protein
MTQTDIDRIQRRLKAYQGPLQRQEFPLSPEVRRRIEDEHLMMNEIQRCWALLKYTPQQELTVQEQVSKNARNTHRLADSIIDIFKEKK